jgi:metal-sulfur cluster biosynthetic enzyme
MERHGSVVDGIDVTTEEIVLRALQDVNDPCSVSVGCPISVVDMGIVRSVSVDVKTGAVDVIMRLTAPGCMYQLAFQRDVRQRLECLDGVTSVTVDFDSDFEWSEDEIAPAARVRLAATRQRRLEEMAPLKQRTHAGTATK